MQQGIPVIPSRWADCLKDPKDVSTKKLRLVARGDRDQSEHDDIRTGGAHSYAAYIFVTGSHSEDGNGATRCQDSLSVC